MQGEQTAVTLTNPGETWRRNTNCLAGREQFSIIVESIHDTYLVILVW